MEKPRGQRIGIAGDVFLDSEVTASRKKADEDRKVKKKKQETAEAQRKRTKKKQKKKIKSLKNQLQQEKEARKAVEAKLQSLEKGQTSGGSRKRKAVTSGDRELRKRPRVNYTETS